METSNDDKVNIMRQKLWLTAGECCWLAGVSYNTWQKLAMDNSIKTNCLAQGSIKYLSADVFSLMDKVLNDNSRKI